MNPYHRKLPDERKAIIHKFEIEGGHDVYINTGMHEDGSLGEVFITYAKTGSSVSGTWDFASIALSTGFQYGVPLKELAQKYINMQFEPYGRTSNPEIPYAKSIPDYIFRWLGKKFLSHEDCVELGI